MELKLLLEKYKSLGFSEKKIKEITFSICENNSLRLEKEDIEIKSTEIRIKISGTKRTHFVLIKQKLEQALFEEFKKEGLKVTKIF